MVTVYLAEQTLIKRKVAKKELNYILENEPDNEEAQNLLHTLNKNNMGEAFAKGLAVALLLGIFSIIAFIYRWINQKINGAEINRADEKYKFLERKFKGLEGKKDEKTGREIKEICIAIPINPKKNWKVYKTIRGYF